MREKSRITFHTVQTNEWTARFSLLRKRFQRLQVVPRQADIKALPIHDNSEKPIFLSQPIQRRGELEFAALAYVVLDVFLEICGLMIYCPKTVRYSSSARPATRRLLRA
jgi:hypothetical protein